MNREQKSNYVSSLKESLNNNEAMMIYHYQGLNVNQLDDLRNQMREAGALLKVTKNRITKIALKDTQHEEAISLFSGQTPLHPTLLFQIYHVSNVFFAHEVVC